MNVRKCIYTGEKSDAKDKILLDTEIYNWTLTIPTTKEYKEKKKNRQPTALEIEAHETFYLIELCKVRMEFLEKKLEGIQKQIKEQTKIVNQSLEDVDLQSVLDKRKEDL